MTHFPIRDEGVQTIYYWDWDGMILVSSLCSNFKWQSKNVLNRGCQSHFHFFYTPFWMSFTLRIENEGKNSCDLLSSQLSWYLRSPWCSHSMNKNRRYKLEKTWNVLPNENSCDVSIRPFVNHMNTEWDKAIQYCILRCANDADVASALNDKMWQSRPRWVFIFNFHWKCNS